MDLVPSDPDDLDPGDLPVRGLEAVLTGWSGGGMVRSRDDLLRALAGHDVSDDTSHSWSENSIMQRASRIIWSMMRPRLAQLCDSPRAWIDALPARSDSRRLVSNRPLPPVNWTATALMNRGWPPPLGDENAVFVSKRRERLADDLLASTLRWFDAELRLVHSAASRLYRELRQDLAPQMDALAEAVRHLGPGPVTPPSWADLRAVAREGPQWRLLAELCDELLSLRDDPMHFCMHVLWPTPELRGRLFHLAVYGEAISALTERDYEVVSTGPITASAQRPTHIASGTDGSIIQLWFEASGAWRAYGARSTTYRRAVRGGPGPDLSPDCLLVAVDSVGAARTGLVLECKDSGSNRGYATRNGYLQALAYGVELAVNVGTPTRSFSIGRNTMVDQATSAAVFQPADACRLEVGVAPSRSVDELVASFASWSP